MQSEWFVALTCHIKIRRGYELHAKNEIPSMWKTEIYIKSWFELLVTYYDINLINSVKLTYRNVEE